jgi:hypothetical protein
MRPAFAASQQVAMKRDESCSPSLFTFRSDFALFDDGDQNVGGDGDPDL